MTPRTSPPRSQPKAVDAPDIVDRLRDWGHPDWFYVTTDLLSDNQDVRFDAADEIERLRAALSAPAVATGGEPDQRMLDDMTLVDNVRKSTIEECARVADAWVADCSGLDIRRVNASVYATDAVKDVADAIRALAQAPATDVAARRKAIARIIGGDIFEHPNAGPATLSAREDALAKADLIIGGQHG